MQAAPNGNRSLALFKGLNLNTGRLCEVVLIHLCVFISHMPKVDLLMFNLSRPLGRVCFNVSTHSDSRGLF